MREITIAFFCALAFSVYGQMGRYYDEESESGWISWLVTAIIVMLAFAGVLNNKRK